jgi:hypothetical protein
MIKSQNNPRFAGLSDKQVQDLYIQVYKERKAGADKLTDEQLDALESELFWIDDELCARDLDIPRFN